jgi:hypothetical protein
MNFTTSDSGGRINSEIPVNAIVIYDTSVLNFQQIDTITLQLSKVGNPTGTAEIGVFNDDTSVKQLFGTIDAEKISTEFSNYSFSLQSPQTYPIHVDDKIGIKFTGGDSSNYILVMRDVEEDDQFDDGNTVLVTYSKGLWSDFEFFDLYMQLSQTRPAALLGLGENETYDPTTFVYNHTHDPAKMYDDFSYWPHPWHVEVEGTLSPDEKWMNMYHGGGFIDVKPDDADPSNNVMVLQPEFVDQETRAPLAVTAKEYKDFTLSLDMRTDKQLRPDPNPWEMAWVKWRYVDETHFYYFVLKPNGAEVGKYDGGENPKDQLFVADAPFPTTYVGKWDHIDIIAKGNHVIILVNGKIAHDFDDVSSFDTGRIGLYNEDARTSFDNITIIPN